MYVKPESLPLSHVIVGFWCNLVVDFKLRIFNACRFVLFDCKENQQIIELIYIPLKCWGTSRTFQSGYSSFHKNPSFGYAHCSIET